VSARLKRLSGRFHCGLGRFRDDPFHLSGADFILSDAAWLSGTGFHDWRRSTLELAGAASSDKDVSVIAVEAFDQLHKLFSQRTPNTFLDHERGEKNPEWVAPDRAYFGGNIVRLLFGAPGLVR